MHEKLPDSTADARAAARTNLFLAATLHVGDGAHPVKIRDLSVWGAQIESGVFPEVGSPVTLVRGRLSLEARVTWHFNGRCGLQFASAVSVREWMANPANTRQQRVDQLVAAVTAGAVPLAAHDKQGDGMASSIAEDLRRVSRLLGSLGDAFASDPELVTKHGFGLQNLAIAAQTLTALAATMATDATEDRAASARLFDLRASCAEVLGETL